MGLKKNISSTTTFRPKPTKLVHSIQNTLRRGGILYLYLDLLPPNLKRVHGQATATIATLCFELLGGVPEGTSVAVDAGRRPLVVGGVEGHVHDGVAVDAVFRLVDWLTRADIIHAGCATLWPCEKVAIAVGYFEAYLLWSVLVTAGELADWFESDTQVPKEYCVVGWSG